MGAKTRPPHAGSGLALRGVQDPFGLTSCGAPHDVMFETRHQSSRNATLHQSVAHQRPPNHEPHSSTAPGPLWAMM